MSFHKQYKMLKICTGTVIISPVWEITQDYLTYKTFIKYRVNGPYWPSYNWSCYQFKRPTRDYAILGHFGFINTYFHIWKNSLSTLTHWPIRHVWYGIFCSWITQVLKNKSAERSKLLDRWPMFWNPIGNWSCFQSVSTVRGKGFVWKYFHQFRVQPEVNINDIRIDFRSVRPVVRSVVWSKYHRIEALGAVSIRKTVLPGMAIPMLKIRRPNGRLIFNMEIAIRR